MCYFLRGVPPLDQDLWAVTTLVQQEQLMTTALSPSLEESGSPVLTYMSIMALVGTSQLSVVMASRSCWLNGTLTPKD